MKKMRAGIFNWPGFGNYALKAIIQLDYPPIMAAALVVAMFFIGGNLLVDLVLAWIDPRIAY